MYQWFFPSVKKPSAETKSPTDALEGDIAEAVIEVDEDTRARRREIGFNLIEVAAILRAYKIRRFALSLFTYTEERKRGGPASRTTFVEWVGKELDGRLDRHRRRLVAFGTKDGEREDLLALEELYVRAEVVSPATIGYASMGFHADENRAAHGYDGDRRETSAKSAGWLLERPRPWFSEQQDPLTDAWGLTKDSHQLNKELTNLQWLFVISWREYSARLRRELRESQRANEVDLDDLFF